VLLEFNIKMKKIFYFLSICAFVSCSGNNAQTDVTSDSLAVNNESQAAAGPAKPVLDTAKYDELNRYLANGDTTGRWPVKGPYPLPGAILPFNRVVAYYGNLYSNRMGALGKWPKQEMMERLRKEVQEWSDADSVIKAIPALHYIAITAQPAPGKDGMYRFRMPYAQLDTVLSWAKEMDAIVFIDLQIGLSTLIKEAMHYEPYLSLPNVHLGIDPEFAMAGKGNKRPGSVIGTVDAAQVNEVTEYLAELVRKNNLPPKMFMIHRFTQGMVTNYQNIKLYPELQIIMDMDGWGGPAKKKSTYYSWIAPQPVQYTGFKLFYVNDTEYSNQKELMPKKEVLGLRPSPIYIQYQ
jgi:hypothetical protein